MTFEGDYDMIKMNYHLAAKVSYIALFLSGIGLSTQVQAETTIKSPSQSSEAAGGLDFAHAKAMPLPQISRAPSAGLISPAEAQKLFSSPGAVPGSNSGDGKQNPVQLAPKVDLGATPNSQLEVSPQEFGTSNHPFTTARANAAGDYTARFFPYDAAGKLFFKIGTSTYVCSASLIKPGLVVTAAHCVANFGQRQFYSGWLYVPAYNNGTAPYGSWTAREARVLTSYYNGTDSCAVKGVVCRDDVAVIALNKQGTSLPGNRTGWLGYGWNGWGYNGSGQALITQLGYPVALDSGALMERNDSQGFVSTSLSSNTVIGSLETGGSSGGPWAVNLGIQPVLNGTSFGTYANHNIVVGVTSWGYISTAIKQQGAAPFTSTNIKVLVAAECAASPGVC